MSTTYQLGFMGAGNMAEGILAAVLKKNLYAPRQVIVSDPVAERRELFARQFGVAVTDDNRRLVSESQTILLAVKPQSFAEAGASVAELVRDDHLFISIMAGVGTQRIETTWSPARVRVIRVMPNLPIRVGAGIAGVCAGKFATPEDITTTRAIFDAGGSTVLLNDESLMDAVTAVSGSGPAYFYYFVEALVAGGTACGLAEEDALKLAEYTCLGAAKMMLETGEPPAELRGKVTSKGGTTQAALDHMERAGVSTAIREAVKAAFNRGRELGT